MRISQEHINAIHEKQSCYFQSGVTSTQKRSLLRITCWLRLTRTVLKYLLGSSLVLMWDLKADWISLTMKPGIKRIKQVLKCLKWTSSWILQHVCPLIEIFYFFTLPGQSESSVHLQQQHEVMEGWCQWKQNIYLMSRSKLRDFNTHTNTKGHIKDVKAIKCWTKFVWSKL